MVFTEDERAYLTSQRIGRLATIGPDGGPQVRPVGFRLNDDDTIDIGGPDNAHSQKYRNVRARPVVSFVVDDMAGDGPYRGWGRGVEIRGEAELVVVDVPPVAPSVFSNDVIRVRASKVNSWHLAEGNEGATTRSVR